jgi:transcriptional regulator of arginine metabolism
MTKSRRHRLILEIISDNAISSQDQLASQLKSNKVDVTQSTLSRDLKELRITRVSTGDAYRYAPPSSESGTSPVAGLPEKLREIASLVVVRIQASDAVVAVTTLPGRAQGLASFLDTGGLTEIMATVAGDDTVIVFPQHSKKTEKLRRSLVALLGL